MQLRTPLKEARGLGAAQHGVGHWWAQRVSALALVPLLIWFVIGIAAYSGAGYERAVAWIGAPVNAVLLAFVVVLSFYHGALGLQVVLEDYIDHEGLRLGLIFLEKALAALLAAAAIMALLTIALGD